MGFSGVQNPGAQRLLCVPPRSLPGVFTGLQKQLGNSANLKTSLCLGGLGVGAGGWRGFLEEG